MSFSHQISVASHSARLDCGTLGQVHELESALDGLLGEATFGPAFDLLVDLGEGGPMLDCTRSTAVAGAFDNHRGGLQGRIALYASGERGRIAVLLIAMIGRHHGLRMQGFRERITALEWTGGFVGQPA
jgi:hypothetical protein